MKFNWNEKKVARIAAWTIFLALIRCIMEPFRLQYYSETEISFVQIMPFLIGAALCSVGLLLMTILSYYERHKAIIIAAALVVAGMVTIKILMLN